MLPHEKVLSDHDQVRLYVAWDGLGDDRVPLDGGLGAGHVEADDLEAVALSEWQGEDHLVAVLHGCILASTHCVMVQFPCDVGSVGPLGGGAAGVGVGPGVALGSQFRLVGRMEGTPDVDGGEDECEQDPGRGQAPAADALASLAQDFGGLLTDDRRDLPAAEAGGSPLRVVAVGVVVGVLINEGHGVLFLAGESSDGL